MPEAVALALSLLALALAAALGAAVTRPAWLPEAAVAVGGAVVLVALGAISFRAARHALGGLGPIDDPSLLRRVSEFSPAD